MADKKKSVAAAEVKKKSVVAEGKKNSVLAEGEKKPEEEAQPPPPPPPPPPEVPGEYSVWAIPELYDPTLHLVMTQLREGYEGPAFGPHCTVLGAHTSMRAVAEERLQALCASTLPYTMKVKAVQCGETYYQSVYLLVHPTDEVLDVHVQALGCFGQIKDGAGSKQAREKYMPHMSLLYGHLTDEELQLAKAKVEAEHGKLLIGKEYRVSHLTLYLTDTNDESCVTWKKVAEFPLREPDKPIWAT